MWKAYGWFLAYVAACTVLHGYLGGDVVVILLAYALPVCAGAWNAAKYDREKAVQAHVKSAMGVDEQDVHQHWYLVWAGLGFTLGAVVVRLAVQAVVLGLGPALIVWGP